jgi:hypothetical protein
MAATVKFVHPSVANRNQDVWYVEILSLWVDSHCLVPFITQRHIFLCERRVICIEIRDSYDVGLVYRISLDHLEDVLHVVTDAMSLGLHHHHLQIVSVVQLIRVGNQHC